MEEQHSFLKKSPATKASKPTVRSKKPATAKKAPGDITAVQIFLDGASRGNPGQAGAGVYAVAADGAALLKKGFYLKQKTNNQAEYMALILAALWVREVLVDRHDTLFVTFTSDSQLLIRQMLGQYKVKNEQLIHLHACAQKILHGIPHTFTHVLREYNTTADALANEGTDKKRPLSAQLTQLLDQLNIHL